MNDVIIYTLSCPITNEIKYIGKTSKDINVRFKEHLTESKSKKRINKRTNWIKSLLNNNLLPIPEILDIVNDIEWEFWERHYISLYKSWGFKLTNMTDGGDGQSVGYSPLKETRELMSVNRKGENNSFYGKKHNEETKKKISESKKGKTAWNKGIPGEKKSEHIKQILSEKLSGEKNPFYGKKHTEESKRKAGEKNKGNKYRLGKKFSEESKAKMRASSRAINIVVLNEFNEYIETIRGLQATEKKYSIHSGEIKLMCNTGKIHKRKRIKFMFLTDYNKLINE